MNLKVGVLFGGRSGEHEVSLMSARSVLGALDRGRYQVIEIGITKEGRWLSGENVLQALLAGKREALTPTGIIGEPGHGSIYRIHPGQPLEILSRVDVIFPVLHGSFGEDGTLQGLLEMAEIPYVGAGVLGSAVGMDKALFKSVMKAEGIPTLDYVLINAVEVEQDLASVLDRAEAVADYPLFVKPANMGSSVGVSKCSSRSDLHEGIFDALRYDRRVIVERGVEAREIEVSVLGNEQPLASIAGEIVPGDAFYSYKAKYIDDSSDLIIPADMDQATAEAVQRIAIQAYQAIDCAGMARVDFLLDKKTNALYLNELNTLPGFTQISMYPKLWEASGMSYPQLMDRLIELALQRQQQKARLERSFGVTR